MDPRKKRRNSILKTRNSIGPDGGSGGDTGELYGVNSTRGRRVSFSHTAQVKEFANSTTSSNEGSFAKTSDFNQTMACGDIDMDISFIPGEGDDDKRMENEKNSTSSANRTQNFGEMSIMEPVVSAAQGPTFVNNESGGRSDGHQQQTWDTRRSFGSVGGFGNLNEENYPPNMRATGGVFNTTRSKCVSFNNTAQIKEFTNATTSSVEGTFSKTSDFSRTTTMTSGDMDISCISDDQRVNPITLSNLTRVNAEMSVVEAATSTTLNDHTNHTIFTGSGDMSVSTIVEHDILPSVQKKCRKNRMTISTPQDISVVDSHQNTDTRQGPERKNPPREATHAFSYVEPSANIKAPVSSANNHTIFAGPGDMSVSTIEEPAVLPSVQKKCRKNRLTISTPQDISVVESPQNTDRRQGLERKNPPREATHAYSYAEPSSSSRTAVSSTTFYSANNHTIFAGPGDMSVSTIEEPAVLPSVQKKCRKNRLTISTPQDISVVDSPQNADKRQELERKNPPATQEPPSSTRTSVSSATPTFYSANNHTIFAGPGDMSVSTIEEPAVLPSVQKKCRKNRLTISTPHDISVVDSDSSQNADKRQGLARKEATHAYSYAEPSSSTRTSVSSATPTFYSANNHTIFAGPGDMSVSTIEEPAVLPSVQKKCRKNRMTISTAQSMSVVEPSSSSNRTGMTGPNSKKPISKVAVSTVHPSSNHTLFTGPGEMSIDGTCMTPSKSRTPNKHQRTMCILKDMSTVESPRRTSERIKNKNSTPSKLTRVTESVVSTGHVEFTNLTDSVDMSISTLDAPSTPLPVAELSTINNGRKNMNSAPFYNQAQSDPLSLLKEVGFATSGGYPGSNSTMFTGPGDMSMSVIDKHAATPITDKTKRKNRMTICNPRDMSIMEQPQNIGKLPKKNEAPLPPQLDEEIAIIEPVVSAQNAVDVYQEHKDINNDIKNTDLNNPAQSYQEQIYPKITIRKSGATQPQQLHLGKPAPNLLRDPLGKCKIDKKPGDQANPVQFSFGTFGHLKTPKRNKIIARPGPSETSKLRLKASTASQGAQASAIPLRNEKCTKDVGLDCTIANKKEVLLKSVADVSMMTSPMIFTTSSIVKPAAKTIDMGTSPIVILGSGNLSTNRSFTSSKLAEVMITKSPVKPNIPAAAHCQERDQTDFMAIDMSVSTIGVEPSPTPTVVQNNTQRKSRMTIAISKDMDVSTVQPFNVAESIEENKFEISFHPTIMNENGNLPQSKEVNEVISSAPSNYPDTDPEVSTELVDISMLSINEPSPSAAHQSQKERGNRLSMCTSNLTSSLVPPQEDSTNTNNRMDQGSYLIGTCHPISSNPQGIAIAVKGKVSTTPPPTHINQDAEISVEKSGQAHHLEMVPMDMSSSSFGYQNQVQVHQHTENSSSDEDDVEQEDIHKGSVSNLEEEAKKFESCMKVNDETEAEAIIEAVQNISIDYVPRPYSISLVAETFQEDNEDEDAEHEPEIIRKSNFDRTGLSEHSFGKFSNKTLENQAESSFSLAAVHEPSLPCEESPAKVSTMAPTAPSPSPIRRKTSASGFPERPAKSRAFGSDYKAMKEKLLNAPDTSDIYKYMNFKFSLTHDLCALSDAEWNDIARSFSEFLGPGYTESVDIQRNIKALHNSSDGPRQCGLAKK